MGSLKDEMRVVREDHQPREKTDDGERPGGSDGGAVPPGPQINTSQESTTREDNQPKLHSHAEEGGKSPEVLSGEEHDNPDSIQVKDLPRIDTAPSKQQPEADKAATTAATHNKMTISNKFLSNGAPDKSVDPDRGSDLSNPLSPDPRSPAPMGQQHMRTQVSLEVVQCHSAATSPMTPPEGDQAFFFPCSFGAAAAAAGSDAKDAELQVGERVEFCSVATSPMTPKTPSTTAFPELAGREVVRKGGEVKGCVGQPEASPATGSLPEAESPESSAHRTAAGLKESQVTLEDRDQQCQQQRMGSMDQDITILVTHYGHNDEGEDDKTESSPYSIQPEMVKIDEYEELESDGEKKMSSESDHAQDANPPRNKTAKSSVPFLIEIRPVATGIKDARGESNEVFATKASVPESPAPFGCHNMCTQVSLEVVQCQSAATSPMTPPEGDHAFHFPSSFGKFGATKEQKEFCSVATAPMTPRTPTATTFPEIKMEASGGENKEEEVKEEKVEKDAVLGEQEKKVEEEEEHQTEALNGQEKAEEPVQEVSWDERGMTWEVYGAVVEVAVLGTAIQKHLEKQVKKQKKPSMPPPPPLIPSATPPAPPDSGPGGSGSGGRKRGERGGKGNHRRRRNPFRQLMENMQQPHCCSRAHTTE